MSSVVALERFKNIQRVAREKVSMMPYPGLLAWRHRVGFAVKNPGRTNIAALECQTNGHHEFESR